MIALANWAQHIVTFRAGAADFIVEEALIFKLHLVLGTTIFLLFPFTRMVHVFSGVAATAEVSVTIWLPNCTQTLVEGRNNANHCQ